MRSEPEPIALAPSPWQTSLAMIGAFFALLVVLFWPTAFAMATLWTAPTFSHGFAVIPGAVYLAWARRTRLLALNPQPIFWALPVLALCAAAWLLSHLTVTDAVQQFSLVAMIAVVIWGIVGTRAARVLLLPLSFLVFAVPFGEGMVPLLQDFSAWLAVNLLDLSGVPVLLEGRFISVPRARWEVAEVCSGLRALIASLAMGFLYAGLCYRSWMRRIVFFIACAVVPILANGARIYGIVLLGYVSGSELAAATDHEIYGWIFTSLVMLLLLVFGHYWRETAQPAPAPNCPRAVPAAWSPARGARHTALFAVLALVTVGLAPLSAELLWRRLESAASQLSITPMLAQPWKPSDAAFFDWRPQFVSSTAELNRTYAADAVPVRLYMAYFAPSQRGAKMVSTGNTLYDRAIWRRIQESDVVTSCDGRAFRARETSIASAASSLVLWNFYWVDGRCTANAYVAKLLLAKARLLGGRQGSAAFVLAAAGEPAKAAAALADFMAHMSLERVASPAP